MVTVKVHFWLSEKGQRDAIKKGHDGKKEQFLIGEFAPSILDDELVCIDKEGNVTIDCEHVNTSFIKFDEYPLSAQDAVATTMQMQEREKKDRYSKMRDNIEKNGPKVAVSWDGKIDRFVPKDLLDIVKDYKNEMAAQKTAREEEKKRDREEEAKRREEEAKRHQIEKQTREDYVLAYVREHGNNNQRERLDSKLLPVKEAWGFFKDREFQIYKENNYGRYIPMTTSDIQDEYGYHIHLVFSSEAAEEATAEQWDFYKMIKKIDDNASVELRRHVAEDDDGEVWLERYGLLVTLTRGPCQISREFEVPD